MITTRSPLRISLGGGGTDLPSYYREHGGFLIAGAINKYVYINVMRPFTPGIYLKYSHLEHVEATDEVQHPIIREAIKILGFKTPQVEITTLADIPSGTGLGSSGSFTTALLKALYTHQRKSAHAQELAESACDIEINRLKNPVGKQDQFISAFGGLICLTFHKDHRVTVEPLRVSRQTIFELEDNLLLFFTGYTRAASTILHDQQTRTEARDTDMLRNLDYVKDLGYRSKAALESGNVIRFGELMHEHWEHKRRRSAGISNLQIDSWYSLAMRNGAIGGKLVGAGGGGFLMFYASDRSRLRRAMAEAGLDEVRFGFDFEGAKIVLS
jgi:D-glycero-alpha-D-manno-heptose-7-phosphate kinase